jgi:hypothetical protein
MLKDSVKKISIVNILMLAALLLASALFFQKAEAANLTETYVRLDRVKASTATGGMVCAKSATASVETTVKVTFPSGFTVNGTASNWTTTTTNLPTGATAWIGIGTASLVAAQDVTFPSGDMVVGTLYCFNFSGTTTLTTGSAGNDKTGVITAQSAGPATVDSGSYALAVITDDQIVVSAVVPPLFSFSLAGGNTDAFTTNLSTGVSVTTGKTFTITTNAANGWVAWVKSATANGLTSASTGANIAGAATANDDAPTVLGTIKGYAVDVSYTDSATSGTGIVSQAAGWGAEFNGNGTTSGGTAENIFRAIAAADGVTDGDTITLTELASITAIQKAATDYTDTLTVVVAGRF